MAESMLILELQILKDRRVGIMLPRKLKNVSCKEIKLYTKKSDWIK